jgi:hypothetical protein
MLAMFVHSVVMLMATDKKRGMRIGGRHVWKYRHLSTKKTGSRFTIYQIKKRARPAPYGSGMPTGSKLVWNINAKQNARKVKGGYKVTMQGYKGQGAFRLPVSKWVRTGRGRAGACGYPRKYNGKGWKRNRKGRW